MTNFRNTASVEEIKLPPTCHFDAKIYNPSGKYTPIDEADCESFLRHLMKSGIPSNAASLLGRSEIQFQRKREECANFAAAYDWAMRHANDLLLLEARTRAVDGRDEPIYYKGEECGYVRKYSDTLLALLLKNLHPQFNEDEDDGAAAGQIGSITIISVPTGSTVSTEATQTVQDDSE